jgi:GNAT superfamily N-acetyltransferase
MATLYDQSPVKTLPPGFEFHNPGMSDFKEVAGLLNLRIECDFGAANVRAEAVRGEWQTPGFHPAFDSRVVLDPRGRLIAYVEAWTSADPWIWGCVHPDYEGRGIGTLLLKWAEVRTKAELYVLEPGLRFAPRTVPSANRPQVEALYRNLGWSALPETVDNLCNGVMKLYQDAIHAPVHGIYEKELRPAQV